MYSISISNSTSMCWQSDAGSLSPVVIHPNSAFFSFNAIALSLWVIESSKLKAISPLFP